MDKTKEAIALVDITLWERQKQTERTRYLIGAVMLEGSRVKRD